MKRIVFFVAMLLIFVTTAHAQMIGATNNQRIIRATSSSGSNQNAIGACLDIGSLLKPEIGLSTMWRLGRNRIEVYLTFLHNKTHNNININAFGINIENITIFTSATLKSIYQWVWNINSSWKWYAGLGLFTGYYWQTDEINSPYGQNNSDESFYDDWYFGILSQLGVEYALPRFPLQISIDIQPSYNFNSESAFGILCIGARYRF